MHPNQRKAAINRILKAEPQSYLADKAIQMLQQASCEAALLTPLNNTRQAPPALEALCALTVSSLHGLTLSLRP
ncbi:hypothetical protein ACFL3F_04245 [Planctomycetota bacterium]